MKLWKENGDQMQYEKMMDQYMEDMKSWNGRNQNPEEENASDPKPIEPSPVSYDDTYIYIHYNLYAKTAIAWSKIENNCERILEYVYTLSLLSMITPRMIADFIACVCSRFGRKCPRFDCDFMK